MLYNFMVTEIKILFSIENGWFALFKEVIKQTILTKRYLLLAVPLWYASLNNAFNFSFSVSPSTPV